MSIKSSLIVTGILCLAATLNRADKQNTSKFTRFVCTTYNNEFIGNTTCGIRLVNRNKTLLNFYMYVRKQFNVVMVNIKLYKKFNVVYKQFLVDVRENFCNYFTKKSGVPYTNILMKIAAPYTNLNHTCPYIGDVFIRNTPMDASKLRDLWPAGEFRVDVLISANGMPSPAVILQIYLEITEKLINRKTSIMGSTDE